MGGTLTTEVSREIAAREGVDPVQLDRPLYDAVDVGALETLVESVQSGDGIEVTFTYYGYEVAVDGSGEVTVRSSTPGDQSGDQPAPRQ